MSGSGMFPELSYKFFFVKCNTDWKSRNSGIDADKSFVYQCFFFLMAPNFFLVISKDMTEPSFVKDRLTESFNLISTTKISKNLPYDNQKRTCKCTRIQD